LNLGQREARHTGRAGSGVHLSLLIQHKSWYGANPRTEDEVDGGNDESDTELGEEPPAVTSIGGVATETLKNMTHGKKSTEV